MRKNNMRGIETQHPIDSKVHHPKELRKNQLMNSLTYVTVVEGSEWEGALFSPVRGIGKADDTATDSLVRELIDNCNRRDIGWVSDPTMQELCAAIDVASWTEGSSLLFHYAPITLIFTVLVDN
nr:hypothetical protein Iba_chr12bCG13670 [Ipomoea batatas]